VADASFAFPPKRPPFPFPITCGASLIGSYAFYFWDPDFGLAGSGVFSAQPTAHLPGGPCTSDVTGGVISCNADGNEYLSEIEDGEVSLFGGEGTMYFITTSDEICGLEPSIEFDVALVSGGNTVLLNTNGSQYVLGDEEEPNAGYDTFLRGRAYNASQSEILVGCYNLSFWAADGATVGNCSLCFGPPPGSSGAVTSADCQCNSDETEFSSAIASGEYFLESDGAGILYVETSGGDICGFTPYLEFDINLANGGATIVGNCDGVENIINGTEPNTGYDLPCAFEGYRY